MKWNSCLVRVCLTFLLACGSASCKSSAQKSVNRPEEKGDSSRPSKNKGAVDGAPLIDVEVSTREDGSLVLGFRMFIGGGANLNRVRVARVNDPRESCEIVAAAGARLLNEWTVGTRIPGFDFVECETLGPGEYEAYAFGDPGDGVRRFLLSRERKIKLLPWSETEEDPSPAPLTEAQRLRLIQDSGVEVLDERAVIKIK